MAYSPGMATMKTKRSPDKNTWAHAELDRVIAEARREGAWSDEATVRVSDPACRDKLTAWIKERIWPGILTIFHATELIPVATGEDGQLLCLGSSQVCPRQLRQIASPDPTPGHSSDTIRLL